MKRSLGSLKARGKPVPVILGAYVNALGIARSLGRAGIQSIVVDTSTLLAFHSKHCVGLRCPNPVEDSEGALEFLLTLGKELPGKGCFFATNDDWLITILRARSLLEPYFLFPMSGWEIVERCLDKIKLYALAEEAGVPCPKTFVLRGITDAANIEREIVYPAVLKPAVTVGFIERLGAPGRTQLIEDPQQLSALQARMVQAGLGDTPVVIQEWIPGGVEGLYTITAYTDESGELLAGSVGHKLRQFPPDAGTITAGRLSHEPTVFRLGREILRAASFHGISNTEFKRDERDGSFKLIEINPRPGMWNYSAMAAGLNLPLLAYRAACGESSAYIGHTDRDLIWLRTLEDAYFSMVHNRRAGYLQYSLSAAEWLRSIWGCKIVDGIFSIRDPYPGVSTLLGYASKALRRVSGRVAAAERR